jgi:hypothetical protein
VDVVPDWRRLRDEPRPTQQQQNWLQLPIKRIPSTASDGIGSPDLALNVQPSSFHSLFTRLKFERIENDLVPRVRAEWKQDPSATWKQFFQRGINLVNEQHYVYTAKGHNSEIWVQTSNEKSMELSIDARLGVVPENKPAHGHPLAPADIVEFLDGLPNSRLVKRVSLYEQEHHDNSWQGGYYTADAVDGKIRFFAQRALERVRLTMNHEWAHLVHDKFPDSFDVFKTANKMERGLTDGYSARPYAKTNDHENFAVHMGEKLIHPNPAHMLEVAEQAPARTAALTVALRKTLTELAPAESCKFRSQYEAREKFLTDRVIPRLRSSLRKAVSEGNPTDEQLELLTEFGTRLDHVQVRNLLERQLEDILLQQSAINEGKTGWLDY